MLDRFGDEMDATFNESEVLGGDYFAETINRGWVVFERLASGLGDTVGLVASDIDEFDVICGLAEFAVKPGVGHELKPVGSREGSGWSFRARTFNIIYNAQVGIINVR